MCRVRVIVRVRPLLPQEQKVSKAVVYVKSQTSLQVLVWLLLLLLLLSPVLLIWLLVPTLHRAAQIRVSKDEVKQFKFTACVGECFKLEIVCLSSSQFIIIVRCH